MLTTTSAAATQTAAGGEANILPPELMKALNKVAEISSLPEITTRIVEIVEDPKSTAADMHAIVRNDPALASKILKVVNSAFYGLPSQIASLDRAIVMLGMSAVKNIALAASLSRLFRPGAITDRFDARDLWTHCIAVGVCARLIASEAHLPPEETFVSALVHDMGLLVEYQLFPDKLKVVVERAEAGTQDFLAAERELIGADHQAFGLALATKWKFPAPMRSVIAYHHQPENLNADLQRMARVVYLADTICCQNEIGFWVTARNQDVTDEMLAQVGLTEASVHGILEVLNDRVQETQAIFAES